MSGLLVTAVFDSALPKRLKPIAAAMASYADDPEPGTTYGINCRPSRARVAWNLDITSRQISRQLAELVKRRILICLSRPAPGRATHYKFDAGALPARAMFDARQRHLPLVMAAELEPPPPPDHEPTGDIRAPRSGDMAGAVAAPDAAQAADILLKTQGSPELRETSGAATGDIPRHNGGHPAPQDPLYPSGPGRTTGAGALGIALQADDGKIKERKDPEPKRLPGFPQLVQVARERRTSDPGEWSENVRRRLIELGFTYDNDAIAKAQRAIEHVDRDGGPPPADASADDGPAAMLRELRARILSAPPSRRGTRLEFPRRAEA